MIKLEELSFENNVVLTIKFDEIDNSIVFVDKNKNSVRLGSNGISLESNKDIHLKSKGNIILDAGKKISLNAKKNIKLEGMNIQNRALREFIGEGVAGAEIQTSGIATIKGSLVQIN